MEQRLPKATVDDLIDDWRTCKVNAMLAMVNGLMQRNGQIPSLLQDGVPHKLSEEPVEMAIA